MKLVADLETNGLYDQATTIHCIAAINLETREEHTFGPDEIVSGLQLLSEAELLIGHNWAGFDNPVLNKLTSGFEFTENIHDTYAMSRMLFISTLRDSDQRIKDFPRNLIGAHSLESWGHRLGEYKGDFGKTTNWKNFCPAMLDYCLQDTRVCLRLYEKMINTTRCQNQTPEEAFANESKVHGILFQQNQNGIGFDDQNAAKLYSKLLGKRETLRQELQDIFKPTVVPIGQFVPKRDNKSLHYREGCELTKLKIIEFNPGSDIQIANRLIKEWNWKPIEYTEKGQAKVDEQTLSQLTYPPAKKLLEYKLVDKRIGSIAEGNQAWLKQSVNGKIHGRCFASGARTLRMSHSSPNLGQIPNNYSPYGTECRSLFIPTKRDWWMMDVDLSSIELRLLAHRMAPYDDGEFASVVADGDPHTLFQSFTGIQDRPSQKQFTYAMIYGSGNHRLGNIVAKSQEISATDKQLASLGSKAKKSIYEKMPALSKLQDACERANQRGWIKLLDGRYAKCVSAHSSLNTLIQGDGSCILKYWMTEYWDLLKKCDEEKWDWLATVHDEILLQALTKTLANQLGELAQKALEQAAQNLNVRCKLDCEFTIGQNWSEVH